MRSSVSRRLLCGAMPLLLGSAGAAWAQADRPWPDRPVRLVNSGAPGSGIDLMARLLSAALAARFGQPFPVENRPGAGSILAAQAHAQARPGESLLLGATGIASTVPFTAQARVPYDPDADLVPVAIPASEFLCWAVPAGGPRSLAELIAAARGAPGTLNWYSVPGYVELDTRRFFAQRGVEAVHVAYQGSPPAVLDLAAGRIGAAVLPLTPAMPAIRDGRLRPLAVTSGVRAPALPEVPTVEQAGFEDLRYDPFTALFGWRGMPAAQREAVAEVVAAVAADPASTERLREAGIVPRFGPADELAQVIALQRSRVQDALRVTGARGG
jgi:tripartite-type tricarboxylate transporter receptor subunit TctC